MTQSVFEQVEILDKLFLELKRTYQSGNMASYEQLQRIAPQLTHSEYEVVMQRFEQYLRNQFSQATNPALPSLALPSLAQPSLAQPNLAKSHPSLVPPVAMGAGVAMGGAASATVGSVASTVVDATGLAGGAVGGSVVGAGGAMVEPSLPGNVSEISHTIDAQLANLQNEFLQNVGRIMESRDQQLAQVTKSAVDELNKNKTALEQELNLVKQSYQQAQESHLKELSVLQAQVQSLQTQHSSALLKLEQQAVQCEILDLLKAVTAPQGVAALENLPFHPQLNPAIIELIAKIKALPVEQCRLFNSLIELTSTLCQSAHAYGFKLTPSATSAGTAASGTAAIDTGASGIAAAAAGIGAAGIGGTGTGAISAAGAAVAGVAPALSASVAPSMAAGSPVELSEQQQALAALQAKYGPIEQLGADDSSAWEDEWSAGEDNDAAQVQAQALAFQAMAAQALAAAHSQGQDHGQSHNLDQGDAAQAQALLAQFSAVSAKLSKGVGSAAQGSTIPAPAPATTAMEAVSAAGAGSEEAKLADVDDSKVSADQERLLEGLNIIANDILAKKALNELSYSDIEAALQTAERMEMVAGFGREVVLRLLLKILYLGGSSMQPSDFALNDEALLDLLPEGDPRVFARSVLSRAKSQNIRVIKQDLASSVAQDLSAHQLARSLVDMNADENDAVEIINSSEPKAIPRDEGTLVKEMSSDGINDNIAAFAAASAKIASLAPLLHEAGKELKQVQKEFDAELEKREIKERVISCGDDKNSPASKESSTSAEGSSATVEIASVAKDVVKVASELERGSDDKSTKKFSLFDNSQAAAKQTGTTVFGVENSKRALSSDKLGSHSLAGHGDNTSLDAFELDSSLEDDSLSDFITGNITDLEPHKQRPSNSGSPTLSSALAKENYLQSAINDFDQLLAAHQSAQASSTTLGAAQGSSLTAATVATGAGTAMGGAGTGAPSSVLANDSKDKNRYLSKSTMSVSGKTNIITTTALKDGESGSAAHLAFGQTNHSYEAREKVSLKAATLDSSYNKSKANTAIVVSQAQEHCHDQERVHGDNPLLATSATTAHGSLPSHKGTEVSLQAKDLAGPSLSSIAAAAEFKKEQEQYQKAQIQAHEPEVTTIVSAQPNSIPTTAATTAPAAPASTGASVPSALSAGVTAPSALAAGASAPSAPAAARATDAQAGMGTPSTALVQNQELTDAEPSQSVVATSATSSEQNEAPAPVTASEPSQDSPAAALRSDLAHLVATNSGALSASTVATAFQTQAPVQEGRGVTNQALANAPAQPSFKPQAQDNAEGLANDKTKLAAPTVSELQTNSKAEDDVHPEAEALPEGHHEAMPEGQTQAVPEGQLGAKTGAELKANDKDKAQSLAEGNCQEQSATKDQALVEAQDKSAHGKDDPSKVVLKAYERLDEDSKRRFALLSGIIDQRLADRMNKLNMLLLGTTDTSSSSVQVKDVSLFYKSCLNSLDSQGMLTPELKEALYEKMEYDLKNNCITAPAPAMAPNLGSPAMGSGFPVMGSPAFGSHVMGAGAPVMGHGSPVMGAISPVAGAPVMTSVPKVSESPSDASKEAQQLEAVPTISPTGEAQADKQLPVATNSDSVVAPSEHMTMMALPSFDTVASKPTINWDEFYQTHAPQQVSTDSTAQAATTLKPASELSVPSLANAPSEPKPANELGDSSEASEVAKDSDASEGAKGSEISNPAKDSAANEAATIGGATEVAKVDAANEDSQGNEADDAKAASDSIGKAIEFSVVAEEPSGDSDDATQAGEDGSANEESDNIIPLEDDRKLIRIININDYPEALKKLLEEDDEDEKDPEDSNPDGDESNVINVNFVKNREDVLPPQLIHMLGLLGITTKNSMLNVTNHDPNSEDFGKSKNFMIVDEDDSYDENFFDEEQSDHHNVTFSTLEDDDSTDPNSQASTQHQSNTDQESKTQESDVADDASFEDGGELSSESENLIVFDQVVAPNAQTATPAAPAAPDAVPDAEPDAAPVAAPADNQDEASAGTQPAVLVASQPEEQPDAQIASQEESEGEPQPEAQAPEEHKTIVGFALEQEHETERAAQDQPTSQTEKHPTAQEESEGEPQSEAQAPEEHKTIVGFALEQEHETERAAQDQPQDQPAAQAEKHPTAQEESEGEAQPEAQASEEHKTIVGFALEQEHETEGAAQDQPAAQAEKQVANHADSLDKSATADKGEEDSNDDDELLSITPANTYHSQPSSSAPQGTLATKSGLDVHNPLGMRQKPNNIDLAGAISTYQPHNLMSTDSSTFGTGLNSSYQPMQNATFVFHNANGDEQRLKTKLLDDSGSQHDSSHKD